MAPPTNRGNPTGNWNALPPWWRSVWQTWTKIEWNPKPHSIPKDLIAQWPVWNNAVLAAALNQPRTKTLRQTASHHTTKLYHAAIRRQGFTSFGCFQKNGRMMTGTELRTSLAQHQNVSTAPPIPLSTCRTLIKNITELWTTATTKWSAPHPNQQTTVTHRQTAILLEWTGPNNTSFHKASNKQLSNILTTKERKQPPVPSLKYAGENIAINWKWEKKATQHLTPTRQDLLMRLVRNGLPLGFKRTHLPPPTQTRCPNCNQDEIETPHHLFFQCYFARQLWTRWGTGWTTTNGHRITWRDLVSGERMAHRLWTHPLPPVGGTLDQVWTIIKAAIIRVIWMERNHRVFNPTELAQTTTARSKQAEGDIRQHMTSLLRRTTGRAHAQTQQICTAIAATSRHHRALIWKIRSSHHRTRHRRGEPQPSHPQHRTHTQPTDRHRHPHKTE